MKKLKFGQSVNEIMQVAYVVDDLEAAAVRWTRHLDIGPWVIFEHFSAESAMFYGEPSDVDVSLALAYSGGMCFELIRQNNAAPSVYMDLTNKDGLGAFHHWAKGTETFDDDVAKYQSDGVKIAFSGNVTAVGGLRFAYVDTFKELRGMIELIELGPLVEDFFSEIKSHSLSWDRKAVFADLG